MTHGFDFSERPFLVIWETTRACDLACVHCRASADPNPAPDELTHEEAIRLVREVREMGTPILVFSGGDCLKRTDLPDLIRQGKSLGLRTGAIPAVTPALTYERILELKACGLDQMAFSLDAAKAEDHDAFRRTSGVFDHTLECVRWAKECGLAVQINSLINVHNTTQLDELISLIEKFDLVFWEVFFLVPVGRGKELPLMSAEKFEDAFEKLHELSRRVSFIVKVTEAPHYRRFCIEKEKTASASSLRGGEEDPSPVIASPPKADEAISGLGTGSAISKSEIASPLPSTPSMSRTRNDVLPAERHCFAVLGALNWNNVTLPSYLKRDSGPRGSIGQAPQGVNAGKGFIFVSYRGEVMPSGFLPLSAGNVREKPLKEIYRNSPLLKELRDPSLLKGRCGACPYREICGGSRSRAYAMTGDYLAEDPCCVYQPALST